MLLTLLMTLPPAVLPQDPPPQSAKPAEAQEPPAKPAKPAEAPVADEATSSIWDYLAAKYDADGDGKIRKAEYARGTDFARVDRNGDGVLTAADFERAARFPGGRDGYGGMPAERRERMGAMYAARSVVLAYFRGEDSPDVTDASMQARFLELDMDEDGMIDEAEFACATEVVAWGGPGDAWQLLLDATDTGPGKGSPQERDAKPDGKVGQYELLRYYSQMTGNRGVLRAPRAAGPADTRRDARGRRMAADGAPVGTVAPDFALAPPDGGEVVTLSSWAGKKPVALIFGSYT